MMIKLVKYNKETALVNGYFTKGKKYNGNIFDLKNNTIDGQPFVEINESEQVVDKQMCVIDGVYQEYVRSEAQELELAKKKKIAQCKAYLTKTDWYIIRLADSGDVMPYDVRENRTLARDNIHEIENNCETLEKLNNINTDFE